MDAWLEEDSEFVERTFGPLPTEVAEQVRDCMELCPESDNKFCECPASNAIDEMIRNVEMRQVRACDLSSTTTSPAEPSRRSLLDRLMEIFER